MAIGQVRQVLSHLRKALTTCQETGATDGELLERFFLSHDEAAFELLVWRHHRMVLGVCSRILSDANDVEDAFQATFLILARKGRSIRKRGSLSSWLFGVARRVALEAGRQTQRLPPFQLTPPSSCPEPVDELMRQEFHGIVDEELWHLPEKYRAPVVLCYLDGMTYEEAGQLLGCSKGTISTRLTRARALLRTRLAGRGLAVTSGSLAAWLCANAASEGAPNSLVASTIKAATSLAAGQATGVISTHVAALTEGVLKAMFLSKLKAVGAVVLVLGFFVTGAIVLSYRTVVAQNASPPIAADQDMKVILEGSKAGDRKELVPGIAFRWCPAGKFKMGEGDDAVDVELSKGFWLGETEVTQGQWKKLMGTSPWSGRTGLGARASTDTTPPKEGPGYAASYISYDDALAFCKKLTAREQDAGRLPKTWKYSLPTEAQWEYACRAGTKTRFSFGDDESQLSQYAWFSGNVDKLKEPYAHQVGLKKPNRWGLHDMHGNVWEWCSDWYASKCSGGKDPIGPATPPPPVRPPALPDGTPGPPDATSARNRVTRGGSWVDVVLGCSSANRFYYNPRLGNSVQGFRIAMVLSSEVQTPQEPEEAKEKEAFTAWGKEVGGLQAGLGFRPGEKRAYHHGETVKLVVRIRNLGKEKVTFQYISQFLIEIPPAVTDGNGKLVPAGHRSLFGVHLPKEVRLAPGKEIELYGELEVRPDFGTGKVSVQYERVFGNSSSGSIKLDPTLSKLATGKLNLEIKSEKPAGWGGGGGKDYELRVDRTVKHGGKASASIKSITTKPTWYGAFTQAFQADKYRGQRLRMTAYVKSKDVENAAGLWMRMEAFDGKGHYSISSDFMGNRSIKGTNDWKEYEVVMDVPKEGAALIYFGVLLAGKGQVWVDDFKFEVVGNDVMTTGSVRETGTAAGQPVKGVPTVPRNLDFED